MLLYFNLWEKIKKSYFSFKENVLFFVTFTVLVATLQISRSLFLKFMPSGFFLLLALLFSIFNGILSLNYIKSVLEIVDEKEAQIKDLFAYDKRFFEWMIYHLLFSLMLAISLLCFIFPIFIVIPRFCLSDFYFVQGYGPIESLKKSWIATRGLAVSQYFSYWFLNFLGLISFITVVGAVLSPSLFILAKGILYKELQGKNLDSTNI